MLPAGNPAKSAASHALVEVFPLEPARFHPFPDGRHLVVWEDTDRTAAEI